MQAVIFFIIFSTSAVFQCLGLRLYENCVADNQCPENSRCRPSACDGNTCRCDNGYVSSDSREKCVKATRIGEPCVFGTSRCISPFSMCLGTCQCFSVFKPTQDGRCKLPGVSFVGEKCGKSTCEFPAVCENGVCVCKPPYRELTEEEFWLDPLNPVQCKPETYSLNSCDDSRLSSNTTNKSKTTTSTTNKVPTTPTPTSTTAISPTTTVSKTTTQAVTTTLISSTTTIKAPTTVTFKTTTTTMRQTTPPTPKPSTTTIPVTSTTNLPSTTASKTTDLPKTTTETVTTLPETTTKIMDITTTKIMDITTTAVLETTTSTSRETTTESTTTTTKPKTTTTDKPNTTKIVKIFQTSTTAKTTSLPPIIPFEKATNIFSRCKSDDECPLNAKCRPNGCNGYNCLCSEGYVANDANDACLIATKIDDVCNPLISKCVSPYAICAGVCKCMDEFVATPDGRCRLPDVSFLGGRCGRIQCAYPASCINGVCKCSGRYRNVTNDEYWVDPTMMSQCKLKSFSLHKCNGHYIAAPPGISTPAPPSTVSDGTTYYNGVNNDTEYYKPLWYTFDLQTILIPTVVASVLFINIVGLSIVCMCKRKEKQRSRPSSTKTYTTEVEEDIFKIPRPNLSHLVEKDWKSYTKDDWKAIKGCGRCNPYVSSTSNHGNGLDDTHMNTTYEEIERKEPCQECC